MCYNIIIPSLYPFMVVSSLTASSRYADAVSMPFAWIFRLLNINNRRVMTCCMLSIMGGFATGGYLLNEISISENPHKNMMRIISVVMTMNSPAFVISAVGLRMLGNVKIGFLLYISILISAFITAFILSFVFVFEDNKSNEVPTCRHISAVDAIKSSVNSILNICGVVIVVSALCEVVSLYIDKTIVNWAFSLVCEVTSACNFVAQNCDGNIYLICISLCILPVSSCMQIKSFDKNGAVDIIFLIFSKILQ
ncbi:MAG: hypothetical protein IIV99_04365, partial [Oscillospiraceae bacterium]|nr:hypothetical protein [Oscillospiraceae bacterium]